MNETYTIVNYYDALSGDNVYVTATGAAGMRVINDLDDNPHRHIIDIVEGAQSDALQLSRGDMEDGYAFGAWELAKASIAKLNAND